MKNGKFFLLLVLLLAVPARAFIPPIPGLLKEIYEGRKANAVLLTFRHRVEVKPGEVIDIEEQLLNDRGHIYVIWKGSGLAGSIPAGWERQSYIVSPDRTLPGRSSIFVKYFLGYSSEELKDQLIAEQFMRRDQMTQYKPGYYPDGDPQNWDLRAGYMRHPDIYLHRLGPQVAIAVAGLDEPALKKIVYFDKSLRGIRRLEWKDGANTYAWNFDYFTKMPGSGHYPKRLSFESDGREIIQSDLLSLRLVKDKPLSDFKTQWRLADRSTQPPQPFDTALRTLLSFR